MDLGQPGSQPPPDSRGWQAKPSQLHRHRTVLPRSSSPAPLAPAPHSPVCVTLGRVAAPLLPGHSLAVGFPSSRWHLAVPRLGQNCRHQSSSRAPRSCPKAQPSAEASGGPRGGFRVHGAAGLTWVQRLAARPELLPGPCPPQRRSCLPWACRLPSFCCTSPRGAI